MKSIKDIFFKEPFLSVWMILLIVVCVVKHKAGALPYKSDLHVYNSLTDDSKLLLPVYHISKIKSSINVDAVWEKLEWTNIKAAMIKNSMGEKPLFFPKAEIKMGYNGQGLIIIFRVEDKFVQSHVKDFNGPVYQDACVEFFFSPVINDPKNYFDLEVNCGGTPLMWFVPSMEGFSEEDISQIEIAHSMPSLVFPEITKPVTWTVECMVPFGLLEKYSSFRRPVKGDRWRGNFFKTASKGSNPHYITWSPVKSEIPNFHLPQFFGILEFD